MADATMTHTSTVSGNVPGNYYSLRPGTEYVVIGGRAVPIRGLCGHRSGGCFYPNGGDTGHPIRIRVETHREAHERIQAEKAQGAQAAVRHAGLDASDWG